MGDLIAFYQNRLHQLYDDDSRSTVMKALLREEEVEGDLFSFLLDRVKGVTIETPHDYITYLRESLFSIFAYKLTKNKRKQDLSMMKESLTSLLTKKYWEEFQLGNFLLSLAFYLLDGKKQSLFHKQTGKGAAFIEEGYHFLDGRIPQPIINAELGLIWLYLGISQNNEELLSAGLKMSHWVANLLDQDNCPFHGIWVQEREVDLSYLYSLYSLLFSVAFQISKEEKLDIFAKSLQKKLEELSIDNPPYFLMVFALAFSHLFKQSPMSFAVKEKFMPIHVDRNLGFIRYDNRNMSVICTASGANTGLGAIHKNTNRIISFGPHFAPLADSNYFGLYRTCSNTLDAFKDLVLTAEEDHFQFKGWSRLISPSSPVSNQNFTCAYPGDQWIYFNFEGKQEAVDLKVRFFKFQEDVSLFFVFFVSAQKICIQNHPPLFPGSLQRYQGDTAAVVMEGENHILTLQPTYPANMQVIPLVGKGHFWSADFLVTFPIDKKVDNYSWKVF